ncbi:MAG: Glycosyl transferase, family 2 [Candidatus Moranbacteria bacterium GW2011_GWE2_47_10]|nr:MAG: Glycosyl transferase, family 2 [Candidatus Moranbacteria bacterium GW2011_GWE2_47_10]
MPVYDVPDEFLRPAIESVLGQTFHDFELLIVDDGSESEQCRKTLDEYAKKDSRVRIIRNTGNIGLTKSLNVGISQASGKYIARLDGNDIAHPERLEKQIGHMRKNPDCSLLGSWSDIIDGNGNLIGKQKSPIGYSAIKKGIVAQNPFVHSSWFFRKDIVRQIGGYDEGMLKAQDYDLALRLTAGHEVAILPEFLCSYRFLEDGLSFKKNKGQEKYALAARKNALKKYGYPKSDYLKLLVPEIMHWLVPSFAKKFLIKNIIWKI